MVNKVVACVMERIFEQIVVVFFVRAGVVRTGDSDMGLTRC
jgi:hypothetical protein